MVAVFDWKIFVNISKYYDTWLDGGNNGIEAQLNIVLEHQYITEC